MSPCSCRPFPFPKLSRHSSDEPSAWMTIRAVLLLIYPLLLGSSDGDGADTTEVTLRAPIPTPLNPGRGYWTVTCRPRTTLIRWQLFDKKSEPQGTSYVVHMTSQRWLRPDEVDRTLWEHSLVIVKPKGTQANTALLFIGGGSNGKKDASIDSKLVQVALATNSVVAELGMVPNQPLTFHGDGQPRTEDDLIAYAWAHYLDTGDQRWLPRLPMVKSAVRAMDTVQALMASDEGGQLKIDQVCRGRWFEAGLDDLDDGSGRCPRGGHHADRD